MAVRHREYYNEIDPYCVAWLKNLMLKGLIYAGDIDDRDIRKVSSDDLKGYTHCHFFAGIAGWPLALRLAGWPDDECIWTGSCPCQPFSEAGKKQGFRDARHLWPSWKNLIAGSRPSVVLGEQTPAPLGRQWLARVQADLEKLDYQFAAADLCAAGVAAPHRRQRLWFVAHADSERRKERKGNQRVQQKAVDTYERKASKCDSHTGGLGDTTRKQVRESRQPWKYFDVVDCRDGKSRRVEPGTFPLAHGIPRRVDKLRALGNAIVPQVAARFVRAFMECRP